MIACGTWQRWQEGYRSWAHWDKWFGESCPKRNAHLRVCLSEMAKSIIAEDRGEVSDE